MLMVMITRGDLRTARPMSTMTTRPPLSIRLREFTKLEAVVASNKEELVETLGEKERGEGAGKGSWCRADMMGATERGRRPGDPGHIFLEGQMGTGKLEKLKCSSA